MRLIVKLFLWGIVMFAYLIYQVLYITPPNGVYTYEIDTELSVIIIIAGGIMAIFFLSLDRWG